MKSCYNYDLIIIGSDIAGMVSVENEDHIVPCDNIFARHSKAGNAGYPIHEHYKGNKENWAYWMRA